MTFAALDLRQKLWVAPTLNTVDGDDWHHAESQESWALNLKLPTYFDSFAGSARSTMALTRLGRSRPCGCG
jgi:hypothetical protein